MDETEDQRVDRKEAVAGLGLMASLLLALSATIVYRIAERPTDSERLLAPEPWAATAPRHSAPTQLKDHGDLRSLQPDAQDMPRPGLAAPNAVEGESQIRPASHRDQAGDEPAAPQPRFVVPADRPRQGQ